ncbi:MAG: deoxyribonuclease V [Gammaproteobacteria bacterium]|nr:deoxyribonuclease V [Gammaproteobacteria bacterium]
MKAVRNHNWDLTPKQAIDLQKTLAAEIVLNDEFADPKFVAGVDVGFEDKGKIARAAVAVLNYATLEPVEHAIARCPTAFPYIPGLLSFREIPVVLLALKKISIQPDVILCDGQGIAHPRRLGIASHLGLLLNCACIGVAKTRLVGTHNCVPEKKGAYSPLLYKDEQVGVVLRTRDRIKPLFISPGHKISIDPCIDIVMACITRYRLPETTRHAHRLASG